MSMFVNLKDCLHAVIYIYVGNNRRNSYELVKPHVLPTGILD